MSTTEVQRLDYTAYPHRVSATKLFFAIYDDYTEVTSQLTIDVAADIEDGLFLNGEDLKLLSVSVNGEPLDKKQYEHDEKGLTLKGLSGTIELETVVRIDPANNTELSGLYRSNGIYCTQCEAQGFRRITFFPDRPDVLSSFEVRIEADRAACPILLSNGNLVAEGTLEAESDLGENRHYAIWQDPHLKPCYLFALVAGDLAVVEDTYVTAEGRSVLCQVWSEAAVIDRCDTALEALKKSMHWDEQRYGLSYDLDRYMIVAISDFNMGAMENKGLNVFNTKYVLASPETATDHDVEAIEAVIAHEYFHNWTGNRVTCRDWFQLTLKEGLTVFRDQQFSEDTTSAAVQRIDQVRILRMAQFPEDAGPMSHPIRPESYRAIDNFYTATVYNKGAEIIRMYHTILGEAGFRAGMDLYFQRHDGQAVTCDDFLSAMADANNVDLKQFSRWYRTAGTPRVSVSWNQDAGQLTLRQQSQSTDPLVIPIRFAAIAEDGQALQVTINGNTQHEHVLMCDKAAQVFEIAGVMPGAALSLLRDFSAPVIVDVERSETDLLLLLRHDTDSFNRWEAGQTLLTTAVLQTVEHVLAGNELSTNNEQVSTLQVRAVIEALGGVLNDAAGDPALRALALSLPDERTLAQVQVQRGQTITPDAIHQARQWWQQQIANALQADFLQQYEALQDGPYQFDQVANGRRSLKNVCLHYLCMVSDVAAQHLSRAKAQYDAADNMTDRQAALGCLCKQASPERDAALADFATRFADDALTMDKWFQLQATASTESITQEVAALLEHPDFTWRNPNRVRSVIGALSQGNPAVFHRADGWGYRLLGDALTELNTANPQLAARLAGSFNAWRRYDTDRQQLMKEQLERIRDLPQVSPDLLEIIDRALASRLRVLIRRFSQITGIGPPIITDFHRLLFSGMCFFVDRSDE